MKFIDTIVKKEQLIDAQRKAKKYQPNPIAHDYKPDIEDSDLEILKNKYKINKYYSKK